VADSWLDGKLCLTHLGEPIWFDARLRLSVGDNLREAEAFAEGQRPVSRRFPLPQDAALPGTYHGADGYTISGQWWCISTGVATYGDGFRSRTVDTCTWRSVGHMTEGKPS
jgi:hypothetical protein